MIDLHFAENHILQTIEKVCADYLDKLELLHRKMEQTLKLSADMPHPQSRLHFTPAGLEIVVRYPVTREDAGEIDRRVVRALLDLTQNEANLKTVGLLEPKVQSVAAGASSGDTEQLAPHL